MLGPDGIDPINRYLPPDKIKALQRADPDSQEKFSKILEEEEEERDENGNGQHEDKVDIGSQAESEDSYEESADDAEPDAAKPSEDSRSEPDNSGPEKVASDDDRPRHIDVKA